MILNKDGIETYKSITIKITLKCSYCNGRGFHIPRFWEKKYEHDVERIKAGNEPLSDKDHKFNMGFKEDYEVEKREDCDKCKGKGTIEADAKIEELIELIDFIKLNNVTEA